MYGILQLFGCNEKSTGMEPIEKMTWCGEGGGFADWGLSTDGFWGVSVRPEKLDYWQWQEETLEKIHSRKVPPLLHLQISSPSSYLAQTESRASNEPWPLVHARLSDDKPLYRREVPTGWRFYRLAVSSNAKFGAFLLRQRDPPFEAYLIACFPMERPDEIRTLSFEGDGGGTVRKLIVSNDGRYVGLGGWANGVKIADMRAETILWTKRPKEEISITGIRFSQDGSRVYAVGGVGCLYQFNTKTGKIEKRLWTTSEGKPSYKGERATCMATSADGKWIAAGTGPAGKAYVWRIDGDSKPTVFNHGLGTLILVSISPDSKHIATVTPGMIKIWKMPSEGSEETAESDEFGGHHTE
jgi:WD40 repeat protein